MGNVLSDETDGRDEEKFLQDGFNLESPDADKQINFGTAAPVWQNNVAEDDNDDNINNSKHSSNAGDSSSSGKVSATQQQEGQEVVIQQQQQQSSAPNSGNRSATTTQQQQSQAAANEPPKKLSYIQMAKLGYQELVNAIIRPPRADYKMEALGPPAFTFCGKRFTRTDFTLRTRRGINGQEGGSSLECSHWEPVERATDRIPVVIYLHGNASARLEVIPQLSYLLSLGVAVFAFDFAGSGKSDGDYVSLGYYEREDLSCIVAHLRATNVVSTVALWGRSMGAATALMFGERDPSIACMILDSPFADLTQLCEEMVEKAREQGLVVPGIVVSVAIRLLQNSVKKQAGFNIKSISPIAHADKCFIPALFVAGEHDDFIKKHHSEELYAKYAGDKNIIIVDGDHNSPRPKFLFDSASIFLQSCLQIPHDWALDVPISMNLMCPPWYFEVYELRAARRRQAAAAASIQQQQHASSSGGITIETGIPVTNMNMTHNNNSSDGGANNNNPQQSLLGFDQHPDELGMTSERQRVIQASLFKMLGRVDDESTVITSNAGTNNNTSSSNDKPTDLLS